jgi:Uma2 family endonuclease
MAFATLAGVEPAHPISPRKSGIALRYAVPLSLDETRLESWLIPEGTVPESVVHDEAAQHFRLLLECWIERTGRSAVVGRNLAIRFYESHPRIGIDPDVCLIEPQPEGFADLESLRLWHADHAPPPFCLEVVSKHHPNKDYTAIQDRYAALGAAEVAVFDPTLAGPKALGGPALLQLWRRDELGVLERVAFGSDPAYSTVLDAWLIPESRLLRIAEDRAGTRLWPTAAERERAEKERERAEKERERAEKERERAEKERERAEKERERAARLELEQRLLELERRQPK